MDEQSGTLTSGKMAQHGKMYDRYVETYGDSGGASRFFPQFRDESALLAWLVRLLGCDGVVVSV